MILPRRKIAWATLLLLSFVTWSWASAADGQQPPPPSASSVVKAPDAKQPLSAEYTTCSLRGRVVWLSDALKRRFGIQTDLDATRWTIALESSAGRLYPIAKDDRGRGFWLDERLHAMDLELRVRQFEGSPVVQVVRVYVWDAEHKYELDYWCDICAIPMYELKPCECCQGTTRFRRRLVPKDKEPPSESTPSGGSALR